MDPFKEVLRAFVSQHPSFSLLSRINGLLADHRSAVSRISPEAADKHYQSRKAGRLVGTLRPFAALKLTIKEEHCLKLSSFVVGNNAKHWDKVFFRFAEGPLPPGFLGPHYCSCAQW